MRWELRSDVRVGQSIAGKKGIATMSFTARSASMMIAVAAAVLFACPAEPAETGSTADASAGKLAFNNHCRTCHSVREDDHRLGPSLHGIVGAEAGSSPGFASYSQAMKRTELVWDEDTLDRFLADPEAVIPNNNMKPFKAVPEAEVRQDIIEYLKSEAASEAATEAASD